MLKNIPNRFTRKMLVERLEDGFRGTFDFLYMPIDFNKRCNMGYAFINFRDSLACQKFMTAFHGVESKECLLSRNSNKICEVTYARLQGLEENICSLQASSVMHQLAGHLEWQPLLFDDVGNQVPFPSKKFATDRCWQRRHQQSMTHQRFATCQAVPAHVSRCHEMTAFGGHLASSLPGGIPAPVEFPSRVPAVEEPQHVPGLSSCSVPQSNHQLETTAMLRNIPNNFARDQLLERLNQQFAGTFDFLYMPMDFKNHCNMGYAFINFRDIAFCQQFAAMFHGVETAVCLKGFNSEKICHVTPARVQGLEANVHRLQQSSVGHQLVEHPEWQPLVFDKCGFPRSFLDGRSVHLVSGSQVPQFAPVSVLAGPNPTAESTVMLRNIPNNYTRSMLLDQLNSFRGAFDFLYLPMDFGSARNMGYAFINFRDVDACKRFEELFDGVECRVCLPGFSSAKVCRVTHARVQGLEENIRHLRSSSIMRDLAKRPEWQPLVFTQSGDAMPLCAEVQQ